MGCRRTASDGVDRGEIYLGGTLQARDDGKASSNSPQLPTYGRPLSDFLGLFWLKWRVAVADIC